MTIGVGDVLSYIALRSTAKNMNTASTKIVSSREAYEHDEESNPLKRIKSKITGTHMQRAIENLPPEEKRAVIQKSKESLQKAYDDNEREKQIEKRKGEE